MTNIEVRVRECPDHPDGDVVYLRPVLSLEGGLAALAAMRRTGVLAGGAVDGDALAISLSPIYVRHGAVGWNFHDANGPVPFDVEVLLADYSLAYPVADRADDIYSGPVLAPFLPRLPKSSRNGQTADSTSPSRPSRQPHPKPSAPSSPASSAGTALSP